MKRVRDRKDKSRLRNVNGRNSSNLSADHRHVEVCEITPGRDRKKKNQGALNLPVGASTPLGLPASKRRKPNESHAQLPPLDLITADNTETEVVIVNASIQDDSSNLSENSGLISGSFNDSFSDKVLSSSSSGQNDSSLSLSMDSTEKSEVEVGPDAPLIHDFVDGPEVPKYRLFKLKPASTCLLVLLHGGIRMPVRGLAKVKSLFGKVTVFGFEITPAITDPLPVYCPTNVSYLCLETEEPSRSCGSHELRPDDRNLLLHELSKLEFSDDRPENVTAILKSDSVVLQLSRHAHKPSQFITSPKFHEYLYTGGSAKKELPKADLAVFHKVGLFVDPSLSMMSHRVFKPLPGYDETSEVVQRAIVNGREPPRVMFTGPKNTGKSTALRYQMNRLQNRSQEVCYLEADPGQTEFTSPAILSLHVVNQPLLGPPFTHLQEPVKMYFLGDVTPSELADNYLKILKLLFQEYTENYSHLPLFINTMGWVEGLGLALLRELACLTSPTHLIQMVHVGDEPVNVCNPLPPDNELQCFDIHTDASDGSLLQPEVTCIEAKCQSDGYQASNQREFNLLATLSRIPSLNQDAKWITSITPRVVPWHDVAIYVCHMPVPLNQLLYVANATIVALCTSSNKEWVSLDGEKDKGVLNTFDSTPVCECLGIGIIRAIDHERKLFYILPAVPSDVLPKVNTLLLGSLTIPECILLQHPSGTEAPYVTDSFSLSICGSHPVKAKTYLKRGPAGKGGKA